MAGKQQEKPVWFKVPEMMATGGRDSVENGENHATTLIDKYCLVDVGDCFKREPASG